MVRFPILQHVMYVVVREMCRFCLSSLLRPVLVMRVLRSCEIRPVS